MSRKKSVWTHKKHGKKQFTGGYGFHQKTGRFFSLTAAGRAVVFESHEAAKAAGWKKEA